MESGSQLSDPANQPPLGIANIVGTLIAVLTLVVPIFSISHFSSDGYDSIVQPPAQLFPDSKNTED